VLGDLVPGFAFVVHGDNSPHDGRCAAVNFRAIGLIPAYQEEELIDARPRGRPSSRRNALRGAGGN
jgi:hypothetical protein